ncbi:MAG: hypothetical protein Q8M79_11015 [Dehalococcoidia bacterium]|nr:hypothetical protein [Dehalococcoidia bacterium]
MNRRWSWVAVPLVLTALIGAACGGGDDDATGTPAATSPAGTAPATSDDPADLPALAGRMGGATFSAIYVLQTTGDEGDLTDGTWGWKQDASSNRTRFDIESEGETVVMIMTADEMLFCTEGACFSMAGAGGMFPNLGEMLTSEVDSIQEGATATTSEVTRAAGRTIAGIGADCYDFRDTAENTTGTMCYSPEGVPLFIETESPEGVFKLEATTYGTSVSEADFEAPFPVTAFPGAGN